MKPKNTGALYAQMGLYPSDIAHAKRKAEEEAQAVRAKLDPAKLRTYCGNDGAWWVVLEYSLHDYPLRPVAVFCDDHRAHVKNREVAMARLLEALEAQPRTATQTDLEPETNR
jgi:hypothetical protein